LGLRRSKHPTATSWTPSHHEHLASPDGAKVFSLGLTALQDLRFSLSVVVTSNSPEILRTLTEGAHSSEVRVLGPLFFSDAVRFFRSATSCQQRTGR
jgi:hypothetical protein